jgi:hypothetical protein
VPPASARAWRQLRTLTARNAEVVVSGRLTLAILVGAPLLVVAMFAVLFQPGTFDQQAAADPDAQAMVAYWLAFAGFFFGLTYGLLQVCTEIEVARRERFAGVGIGTYLAAKAAVLVPALLVVDVALVGVLRALDRIPGDDLGGTTALLALLLLDSAVALVLGLLLSALVSDSAQAAMALPMVCFPAVLFAGAIVPVADMTVAGEVLAATTPVRWAFEAVAANLGIDGPGGGGVGAPAALVVCLLALAAGAAAATRRRLR